MEHRTECVKRSHRTELVIDTCKKMLIETLYRLPGKMILHRKCYQLPDVNALRKFYNHRIQYKLSIGYEIEKQNVAKVIPFQNRDE